jgi:hypothetical protein
MQTTRHVHSRMTLATSYALLLLFLSIITHKQPSFITENDDIIHDVRPSNPFVVQNSWWVRSLFLQGTFLRKNFSQVVQPLHMSSTSVTCVGRGVCIHSAAQVLEKDVLIFGRIVTTCSAADCCAAFVVAFCRLFDTSLYISAFATRRLAESCRRIASTPFDIIT